MTKRDFYAGQKVRVVSSPVKSYSDWVPEMDELCGQECTVDYAELDTTGHWLITLQEDPMRWIWNENCFEEDIPAVPMPEINDLL